MAISKEDWIELILNNKDEFKAKKEASNGRIDLSEAEFTGMDISGQDLSNIDFSGTSFAEASITDVNFADCDFTSADFSRVKAAECDFTGCILNGTDMSYGELHFCNFTDTDMAGCILNEADLTDSDFSACENMSACRFDEGTIWPDPEKLPDDFDSTYNYDLSSLQDEEDGKKSDFDY